MGCGFTGKILFEARIKVWGTSVKRRLRAHYKYTPPWPFFDPKTGSEKSEHSELMLELEMQDCEGSRGRRRDTSWIAAHAFFNVLNARALDRLTEQVDVDARIQDHERRRAAQPPDPPCADELPDIA